MSKAEPLRVVFWVIRALSIFFLTDSDDILSFVAAARQVSNSLCLFAYLHLSMSQVTHKRTRARSAGAGSGSARSTGVAIGAGLLNHPWLWAQGCSTIFELPTLVEWLVLLTVSHHVCRCHRLCRRRKCLSFKRSYLSSNTIVHILRTRYQIRQCI